MKKTLKEGKRNLEFRASLSAVKHTALGDIDYGVISRMIVTDAALGKFVDAMTGTYDISNFKYHGSGTGSTLAEGASNTALETEVESRVTGSQINDSGKFKSVATIAYTGTHTITEHGIFDASSGGTLLDRSLDTPGITVNASESITFTYEMTLTAS